MQVYAFLLLFFPKNIVSKIFFKVKRARVYSEKYPLHFTFLIIIFLMKIKKAEVHSAFSYIL